MRRLRPARCCCFLARAAPLSCWVFAAWSSQPSPACPACLPCPILSLQLHVAFSRERSQKEYVQHHMEAHATEIWAILCQSGAVRCNAVAGV